VIDLQTKRRERPRIDVITFMTGLCVFTGQLHEAEGYILELLSICAFSERGGGQKWD
jgi:hypothetical protein